MRLQHLIAVFTLVAMTLTGNQPAILTQSAASTAKDSQVGQARQRNGNRVVPKSLPIGISADWWDTVRNEVRQSEYHVSWQEWTHPEGVSAVYQAPDHAQNLRTYFTRDGIRIVPRNESVGAVYPVTTSALIGTPDWSQESDQVNAEFGYSVGTAGDVNGDGYSDVIVGADLYDSGQNNKGAVFVYHGSADGLSATADWSIGSDQEFVGLGRSVGTAGDVNGDGYSDVIVGTQLYRNDGGPYGRAFVYHGSSLGLSVTPDWTPTHPGADQFGYRVGTAGDVNGDGYDDVIISAYIEYNCYVYYGSASGLSATYDWVPASGPDWPASPEVGTAGDVNNDGYDDVIIGDSLLWNDKVNQGAAFIYLGSASGPATNPSWTVVGDRVDARLGISVDTAGDVNGDGYDDVIVGAYRFDNPQDKEGAAFVFYGSDTGPSITPNWSAEGDLSTAEFGNSVGTAGDVNGDGYDDVIVGAHEYQTGEADEGRVFVYHGSAAGLVATPAWYADSDQYAAFLGESVGSAGDVNGDGKSDVIVGANMFDNGEKNEGAAFVHYGSASGLRAEACQKYFFGSGYTEVLLDQFGESWDFIAQESQTVERVDVSSKLAVMGPVELRIEVKINDKTIASWDQYATSINYTFFTHSAPTPFNLNVGDKVTYHIHSGPSSWNPAAGITGVNYVRFCAHSTRVYQNFIYLPLVVREQ